MNEDVDRTAATLILVFPSASTAFVALRLISRYLNRSYGFDDTVILLAWTITIGQAVIQWQMARFSFDLTPSEQRVASQYNLAIELIYNPILMLVRTSAILFLYRLGDVRRGIRYSLHALNALNIGHGVATFFTILFQCMPVNYAWESEILDARAQRAAGADANGVINGQRVTGGTCINREQFFLVSAGLSTMLDVLLLTIPMKMTWRLQMPCKRKFAVVVILSMGWIVTGISISRIIIFYQIFASPDFNTNFGYNFTVSSIENNMAIIAASIPALSAFWKRIAPRCWRTFSDGEPSGPKHYNDVVLPRKLSASSVTATTATIPDDTVRDDKVYRIDELDFERDRRMRGEGVHSWIDPGSLWVGRSESEGRRSRQDVLR
ncbi:hypothetical protein BDY21DRAFT_124394 [Lineolata rhizophorae]|uniref:Rhodopsin domain-containing protein n=1 Tax=Lineolata rhizophorae TaxID=578093 RepID=A0A6A6NNX2_9PEZI|nr:hypothetical protein BDY21DRAFT_124394 [Lineolata rhizophorae]